MPEIRLNVVTGEWVVIATERARRPEDFAAARERRVLPPHSPSCPFCPGNEAMTPQETFRVPDERGGWSVRAVPNKFSALTPAGDATRVESGLRTHMAGVGLHEVIVETPAHDRPPALETGEQLERVLGCCRERFAAFYRDRRIQHVILFKNHGPAAGTSLEHPHAQIVGTPVVPGQVRARIEDALGYWGDRGACLFCRTLDDEIADGARIVAANESFVSFVPYAALSPFHVWLFPRRHAACFASTTDDEIAHLAAVMHSTLRRLHFGLDDPDYNWVVRSLSPEEGAVRYWHWYLSLVPRVSKAAGFELGTGMYINTALPEASAAFLRGVRLPDEAAVGVPTG